MTLVGITYVTISALGALRYRDHSAAVCQQLAPYLSNRKYFIRIAVVEAILSQVS